MTRCFSCVTIAALVLLNPLSAQDDAAKKDLASLQGVWQCISFELGGDKDIPEEIANKLKKLKMTFKGDKVNFTIPDEKTQEGTFKLNPAKKPKEIDLTPLDGPEKDTTMPGIYSIEGDTLKICLATVTAMKIDDRIEVMVKDRPKEFKSSPDAALIVLKREKR